MEISAAIFRAYDIRGIVANMLTPEAVYYIGRAFATEARAQQQNSVVIGRDGRLSSAELSIALAQGLREGGCDVIDIGLVPTPVLYFATHKLETGTGMMITGSHNPPEYNGIKMMLDGETLHGEKILNLHKRIVQETFSEGAGALKTLDMKDDYIRYIANDIQIQRPLKIAIDCGNGAAAEIAPVLFKALGLQPVELFCIVDGTFPNHHPNPSEEKNLQDLRHAVLTQKLDLGLAFDGDGDRLGVIDGKGQIIWADRQMMMYAADILQRHAGATVIFDVKCSKHLPRVIREAGGIPLMSKTGHSLIKARMRETGAMLAGEMSGHIFFRERWFGFDDGLYTAARLLEILANDARPVQAIFDALPNGLNTPELHIHFAEGEHYRFIEKFQKHTQFPGAEISRIDGVRADFEDGWGLVRASNTTPSLVLRFEGDDAEALRRIQDSFRIALLAVDKNLQLPF